MPVSPVQAAKRAFVSVLLFVARHYGLALPVTWDATDDVLLSAFKKVALKAHPDEGGSHGAKTKTKTQTTKCQVGRKCLGT